LLIYFLGDLFPMVRNTGCEHSDGCSVAVLERMSMDLRPKRRNPGMIPLSFWFGKEGATGKSLPAEADGVPEVQGSFPAFEIGGWRFMVRTRDPGLIGDLENFSREISGHPWADRKFTSRLIQSTEQGRLGGWAWQKERLQES
jgi:hypothetical protein